MADTEFLNTPHFQAPSEDTSVPFSLGIAPETPAESPIAIEEPAWIKPAEESSPAVQPFLSQEPAIEEPVSNIVQGSPSQEVQPITEETSSDSLGIALPENAPEILLTPNIGVIGVGGAGGNAVDNMIESHLIGATFIVANTDAQAMTKSLTHERIQLGCVLTQGLGAGSRPDIGQKAAEESEAKIREALQNLHLLFIAAGMGGGTGTGASPVIAKIAKEMGILTVAVVTKPFRFEGPRKMRIAEEGIEELSKYVDTMMIVPSQNLFRIAKANTSFLEAFKIADAILCQSVRTITDLMMTPMHINVDFADLKTVITNMGRAIMGCGEASGENRALVAAEKAITNPLLDVSMKGAKGILINVSASHDFSLMEMEEAAERIRQEVDNDDANIIVGTSIDDQLGDKLRVSVVATGIESSSEQNGTTVAPKKEFISRIITPEQPETQTIIAPSIPRPTVETQTLPETVSIPESVEKSEIEQTPVIQIEPAFAAVMNDEKPQDEPSNQILFEETPEPTPEKMIEEALAPSPFMQEEDSFMPEEALPVENEVAEEETFVTETNTLFQPTEEKPKATENSFLPGIFGSEIEESETPPLFQEGTSSIDETLIDIPSFLRRKS